MRIVTEIFIVGVPEELKAKTRTSQSQIWTTHACIWVLKPCYHLITITCTQNIRQASYLLNKASRSMWLLLLVDISRRHMLCHACCPALAAHSFFLVATYFARPSLVHSPPVGCRYTCQVLAMDGTLLNYPQAILGLVTNTLPSSR